MDDHTIEETLEAIEKTMTFAFEQTVYGDLEEAKKFQVLAIALTREELGKDPSTMERSSYWEQRNLPN